MKKIFSFFHNSWQELEKVSWPTRKQAISSTTIVLIFTIIAGVLLTLIDFGLTEAVNWLIFNFK